jgi:hypothetical protein
MGHIDMMSDRELALDLSDCLLPLIDPEDRAMVLAYARSRPRRPTRRRRSERRR